ncbi:MAG TPA: tripartite tricarboxylate transporter TctB family protein [Ramlibacter sp.]|nr:tripartite tricarboxylate transporter TctB family protein [Ramlibacter sp.]
MPDIPSPSRRTFGSILAQRDAVGGLVVMAVGAFAFWQGSHLPIGTLGGMGAGMLPKSLAVLLGLLGLVLMVSAVLGEGPKLERWSVRGPLLVLGAVVAFGLAVRPLGLVVAGPLAIVIGGFASDEVRWKETLVFGAVMTAFCVGLFKFALGLPIPLAPWLLGY